MAKKRRPEKSVSDLRQEIAHSRDRLGRDLGGLGYEFDFPLKFRKSFQRNTAIWVSAAVLSGVVFTARSLPSRKKVTVGKSGKFWQKSQAEKAEKGILEAGFLMGTLKVAATVLRPVLIGLAKKKLGDYARRSGKFQRS